jgi:hypothetical protein
MLGDIAQAGRYYHDALRIPDEAMRRTALRTAADLSATAIRTALTAGIPVQVVAAWSPFGRRFIQHLADLADLPTFSRSRLRSARRRWRQQPSLPRPGHQRRRPARRDPELVRHRPRRGQARIERGPVHPGHLLKALSR